MCFQRSSKRIKEESRPPKPGWRVVPQSRTGSRETPVAKFAVCSWHDQLPDVVGMRPQRATTSIREKMTVTSKIRGNSTSERLMHEPRDLKSDSLTNWQPVQLPQHCRYCLPIGAVEDLQQYSPDVVNVHPRLIGCSFGPQECRSVQLFWTAYTPSRRGRGRFNCILQEAPMCTRNL